MKKYVITVKNNPTDSPIIWTVVYIPDKYLSAVKVSYHVRLESELGDTDADTEKKTIKNKIK